MFYAGHDLEALADLRNYSRAILAQFAPHVRGRVLEVGAGIGNFAAHWVDQVDSAVLVEPADNLFARLTERFAGDGRVRALHGTAEEADLPLGGFDATIMVNVLEHVPDDGATVRRLFDVLRPGGVMLQFVPALPAIYGALDEELGHHRRYAKHALADVVRAAGFAIERVRWFDALGILPWFIVGRVLQSRRIDPDSALLYDRVVVPALSRFERRVALPFGKNLICIARKPS